MPKFKNGTHVNKTRQFKRGGAKVQYLRIKAGPQRDMYVHKLVAEAKLGRELRDDETVEHEDGDTLNNRWTNLKVVSRPENTALMHERRKREQEAANGAAPATEVAAAQESAG
jgi:hypothetical protein